MIKLLSLFSGIGAFEKALTNLGVDYELVNFCEFDKYAVKSYCAIHGEEEAKNLGDITKVDETKLPKDIDLVTYGFPCQDISSAGRQRGFYDAEGNKTRSGLFFDALRIIEATKPKVAIAENVKNLLCEKFSEQFKIVLSSLDEAGYNVYYKILNAKDFGVPQSRERVFIVSIRKDIDNGRFKFPKPFPLEKRLKDVLEKEVDEKFYLSDEQVNRITVSDFAQRKALIQKDVCGKLLARDFKEPKCVEVNPKCLGNIYGRDKGTGFASNVYDEAAISPTLNAMQRGNRQPMILTPSNEKIIKVGNCNPSGKGINGTVIDSEGIARTVSQEKGEGQKVLVRDEPTIAVMRGRYNEDDNTEQHLEERTNNITNTITTVQKDNLVCEKIKVRVANKQGYQEADVGDTIDFEQINSKLRRGRVGKEIAHTLNTMTSQCAVVPPMRVRKLTPKECFRLMGFSDEDFEKASKVNSNSQLYKEAGNSIVVDVLENLFSSLFGANILDVEGFTPVENEEEQLELF